MRQPIKFGKYLLLERIAVGGMAEVFVAKAFGVEGFERLLAIKKILPTMGEDREFIDMFVDEARIAVQLAHANIVQVLELGKHDENLYIAMEYISGRDVRQLIERFRKRNQPVPVAQAALIVAEVCEALDYAHRKRDTRGQPLGIVHRDVSPQNVLVSFEGEVKLIDFGIAKAESRLQKTQAGILKGKFSYMSPEQVKGQTVDSRSDIFAAGILLWELICGEKLFTGESDFAVLEKVRNGIVPAPRSVTRTCPEALEKVILKALATEPRERYQTASELHDDLMRFTLMGEMVYGSRQLAEWIREEFSQDFEKEQARLQTWSSAEREDSDVTPSDPQARVPRRPAPAPAAVPAMIGRDLGITPRDPFPGPAILAAAEVASSEPTQQWRIPPDQDTLAVPPTPAAGSTPVGGKAQPPNLSHELPTMKMDGDELIQAEKEFAARRAAAKAAVAQQVASLGDEEERTNVDPGMAQAQQPPPPPAPARAAPPSKPLVEVKRTPSQPQIARAQPPPPPPQESSGPCVQPAPPALPATVAMKMPALAQPSMFDLSEERTGAPRAQRKGAMSMTLKEQQEVQAETKKSQRKTLLYIALPLLLLIGVGLWFMLAPETEVRPGKVIVTPTPSVAADLIIDGKPAGQLPPFVHTVKAGNHKIQVRAEGYKLFTTEVTVPSGGRPVEVDAQMVPEGPMEVGEVALKAKPAERPSEPVAEPRKKRTRKVAEAEPAPEPAPTNEQAGRMRIETDPPGADITVDGKPVGKAPLTTDKLDPGPVHVFIATLEGYAPARRAMKVDANGPADLKLTLAQPEPQVAESSTAGGGLGYLIAATKPAARLTIDGRDTGRWTPVPPANPIALPAGAHTIVFETADGRKLEEQIQLGVGETKRIIRSVP